MLFKTSKFQLSDYDSGMHSLWKALGENTKEQKIKVKIRKWWLIDRVHSPHFYFRTIHLVVIFRDNMLLPLPKHCSGSPTPMLPASLNWCLFLLPGMYFNVTALKVTEMRARLSCELVYNLVLCITLHGTVFCLALYPSLRSLDYSEHSSKVSRLVWQVAPQAQ